MRRLPFLVVITVMCLIRPWQSVAGATGTQTWDVTLKYGKDMTAQWRAEPGQDGRAVWCFSLGRTEVTVLGTDSYKSDDPIWPCWESLDRSPAAEVMVLLTMRAEPASGDRITVTGTMQRWRKLTLGEPANYRAESDEFSRTETMGEPWHLIVGRGPGGEQYTLEVSIARAGAGARAAARDTDIDLPIEFQYEMHGKDISGDSVFRISKTTALQVDTDENGGVLGEGKVSLDHPRRDLYFEVRLNDIRLAGPEGARGSRIEATFLMNRILCLNPIDTGDSTTVRGERTITCSIERRMTLTPMQKIHLKILAPEESDMALNSIESVELKPLRIGRIAK